MKTVFSSHNEVAHIWASQSQSEGRAGNIFFENGVIYSYGRHFPVARFAPEYGDIVLFTSRGYSSSTGKHKGIIRAAIPDSYQIVYCDDVSLPASYNLDIWARRVECLRADFAIHKNKQGRGNIAHEIYKNTGEVLSYCDALKMPAPAFTRDIQAEAAARAYVNEAAEKRALNKGIKEAEKNRLRAIDAAERLPLWLAGNIVPLDNLHLLPTALRIKGDQIETTRGAKIPVSDALKIYPLLDRAKRTGNKLEAGLHNINLGSYRFNSFDGDTLIVGCHSIAWAQIEKMAQELKLTEAAPPLAVSPEQLELF
jgi:hypothetical protein